jgi:hypothetical protein
MRIGDTVNFRFRTLGGYTAQFYRDRARQMREVAEKCRDPEIKEQLLGIADQYDRLATSADQGHIR